MKTKVLADLVYLSICQALENLHHVEFSPKDYTIEIVLRLLELFKSYQQIPTKVCASMHSLCLKGCPSIASSNFV